MGREIQPCPHQTHVGINKRRGQNQANDDTMDCSGKACQSCTARVIADCVAVCCCPCAVVNFFTLTCLKLPWMIGRRCLSKRSKKKKRLQIEGKDGISRKEEGENGDLGKVTNIEGVHEDEEAGSCKYSARFEAERVWLELYRVDNLGFGRVSFNGIQSLG